MGAQVCIDNYIIIPSAHNVAEYRACLQFKPKRIYLVVSTDSYIQKQAERLYQLLIHNIPDSTIQKLSSDGLEGESSFCTARWIKTIFTPLSQAWEGQTTVLNMTGGTKPLSMLLCQAYRWSALHYQPFHRIALQTSVQVLYLKQGEFVPEDEIILDEPQNILDLVCLYADEVTSQLSENQLNLLNHKQSLLIAAKRLEAQGMHEPSNDNLFPVLTPVLNDLWYLNRPKGKEKYHRVSWDKFNLEKHGLEPDQLYNFLQQISQNSPQLLSMEQDAEGVRLPTYYNSAASTWTKWISGMWFEQLVYQWLLELGIKPEHMERDIKIAREPGNPSGETDIILFHQQNIHFIEIKADVHHSASLADLEKQLTSQSSELGMLNKVLIVTPTIRNHANANAWESFKGRCRDRRVKLIVACCKEDLANSETGLNINAISPEPSSPGKYQDERIS